MLFLSVIIAFLTLGALWLAAVLNEHDMHPMRRLAELMKRPALEVALVALVAVGLIHHGATKGTNGVNGAGGEIGGTNGVQNVGGFLTGLTGLTGFGNGGGQGLPALPTTNYQLSTTNLDWLAFGGYVDWFRVEDGAWCFRFGSNLVERVTVFSCGEIASAPFGASNSISLLGLPLSIVPAANWHLLNPQRSLFWHAATPSNTLLLTWENALVRRDTNLPVTVQVELFPDGAAALRYDFTTMCDVSVLSNAEARIVRDGLAEAVPLMTGAVTLVEFAAPTIAGTNLIDEVQARIAGGNTNAYYCADVVVAKGPSKIRVEPMADETNRGLLGAYEIVALPGETNRLPLLIGPKYTVSAEVAFESFELVPPPFVPLADDTGTVERLEFGEAFSATNVTDRLVEVQWPVEFALEEIDATPEATTYALRVTPDWLDGEVTWYGIADTNAPPMRGSPPMRSGGDSCSCGCLVRDGLDLIHSQICSCEHCSAEGECSYEGHSESISLDMKDSSSGGEGNSPGGNGSNLPDPDLPSVSVSFDKNVVIFEAPYESSPGVIAPLPSSIRTKLTVSANGGENGGMLTLVVVGGLGKCSGESDIPQYVQPGQTIEWTADYEGVSASGYQSGAVATAVLIENGSTNAYVDDDTATVVEIQIEPIADAPTNNVPHRHKVGVCERVNIYQSPLEPVVQWTTAAGTMQYTNNHYRLIAPLNAIENPIIGSCGNVTYRPNLTVVEPQGILPRNVRPNCRTNELGRAGWTGLFMDLYVTPLDVSFSQIAVEEVPCTQGSRHGYFEHVDFSDMNSHTRANGAGGWNNVNSNNLFDEDDASVDELPRMRWDHMIVTYPDPTVGWLNGYFEWNIPYGWNVKGTSGETSEHGQFATETRHRVDIDTEGTVTLRKLNKFATRTTNDVVFLNGVMQ